MVLKKVILGFILGAFVVAIVGLISAAQIMHSNTPSFCGSCHEMKLFYSTWENGPHGLKGKGAYKAKCVDCHLPHEGFLNYLVAKITYGINDYYVHLTGAKAELEHWIEHWKKKRPYVHQAYESGCKSCHKELVGGGIPIKAFLAHRAYLLGETRENCISCHQMVGHGDVVAVFMEKIEQKNK